MKWIEMIRVRSSEAVLRQAMPRLRALVHELTAAHQASETLFLQHALYDGDLSVVLIWQTSAPAQKTPAGLRVADHLRELGSIDHAVWLPTAEAA